MKRKCGNILAIVALYLIVSWITSSVVGIYIPLIVGIIPTSFAIIDVIVN